MNSTDTPIASESCQTGIDRMVRFKADAMQHIELAIETDIDYCLPRVAKAWMLYGANDDSFTEQIANLRVEAQQLLPVGDSKESELLSALEPGTQGFKLESATRLESLLKKHPTDTFLHVLAQEATFWLGEAHWMREIVELAAPHWRESDSDYGPFLSLRAFANEEAGYFEAAQRYGMEAVEIDPTDVWGAHAVAHVLLMKGEIKRGVNFLDCLSRHWTDANQMQHHLWWHYCLFLLEMGEHNQILDLLDTKIRNPDSPLIKRSPGATIDINNYASLLMRLELYGVDVSAQWQTLAEVCSSRTTNHASVFSNTHDMMVLTSCGKSSDASSLLKSMTERYADPSLTDSVAQSYREVGIPVCQAILAHRAQHYQKVLDLLGNVRRKLTLLGASHAQRDVFFHLLVHAASKMGRDDLLKIYLRDIETLGFNDVPGRAAYKHLKSSLQ